MGINALSFYETSSEYWAFGKRHIKSIQDSLQAIKLEIMTDIILDYLGRCKGINHLIWNHPNYTTFIHTKGTPLDTKKNKRNTKSTSDELKEYKLMMLGVDGVGKSALTMRFITDEFRENNIDPTIEDSYLHQVALNVSKNEYDKYNVKGSHNVWLDVLDTAMDEEFSSKYCMMDAIGWYRDCDIFVLVFSVICQKSFAELTHFRESILRIKEEDDYPMMVVGNKCDLRIDEAFNDSHLNMDDVIEWCQKHQMPYIETSAKNGKNVHLLFRQSVYEYILYETRNKR